jgi:TolB-like protein
MLLSQAKRAGSKWSAGVGTSTWGKEEVQFIFSDCVLDPDRRELTRNARPVSIGPKVFDVLLYLVRNRERVVSKDDLLDAVWAGRIVSESTMNSHINAVRQAIGDSGSEQRLIKTVARKGFRCIAEVAETPPPSSSDVSAGFANIKDARSADALAIPKSPSIAVLPFVNLSADLEQEYFADGMVEDIIAALSHMRWLFVIARNSSFIYKGRRIDVRQVGSDLGVRYLLEGSVRSSAGRVRITAQLIDTATGGHLWAGRFDGTLDDVFELQDHVVASVVGAIAPQLERAEIVRAQRKSTASLDAHDYYLRGMASFNQGTREAVNDAIPLFYEAIKRDPDFASAHGMAAWCHFWRKINGWMTDPAREIAEGVRLGRRAVELGRDYDAVALTRGGHALAHLAGELDSGIVWIDRALMLNPHLAAGWFLGGYLKLWHGEPEAAIERLARAMRLSPFDPEMHRMQAGTAMAHMLAGRFDDAVTWAECSLRDSPNFLMATGILTASQALAGRLEEARRALTNLLQLDPALRQSKLETWLPFRRPADLAMFADGLRSAGLPA